MPADREREKRCLPDGWRVVHRAHSPADEAGRCSMCGQPGHRADQPRECVQAVLQMLDQAARTGRRLKRQLALLEAELHRLPDGGMQRALDMVEEAASMATALSTRPPGQRR